VCQEYRKYKAKAEYQYLGPIRAMPHREEQTCFSYPWPP
jgi:hypothetical protein